MRKPSKPLGHLPCTKCVAHSSQTGLPCKNWAIRGGTVCRKHGGSIRRVKEKAAERVRDVYLDAIDPQRVLREAGRIAYSDIRELFDADGRLLPVKQWPDNISRAVAGVEVVKRNVDSGDGKIDDVIKLKLWDKGQRLQDLMKHHGQLTEKVELTIGGKADRIIAARERASGQR